MICLHFVRTLGSQQDFIFEFHAKNIFDLTETLGQRSGTLSHFLTRTLGPLIV